MADERKRRRMESNRESARRSRVKKQQQLQQIISDIDHFKRQNVQIASKLEEARQRCLDVETEMKTVAAMKMDLEQRLGQLNCIIDKNEATADIVSPTIWRVNSWSSDYSKLNCGDGSGGYWMDGLGVDFDLSLSPSPWRMTPSASSATLSRT